MNTLHQLTRAAALRGAWPGVASGLLSTAVLGWRGRHELDRPLAPLNAPSHWYWGDRALREDGASLRHTAVGAVTHQLSAMMWGALYGVLASERPS